jgi:hypothetical protein
MNNMGETKLELIHTNLRRYTFENKKMKDWVESHSSGRVLNLFAGYTKLDLNEHRVDVDKNALADSYMDALDFVIRFTGNKFDTVILDPPYSYRKSMEMYNGNYNSRFKRLADKLPEILNPEHRIISFGYHSTFMGKGRGYDLEKMCVFAHGGAQHCTITIIEVPNGKEEN